MNTQTAKRENVLEAPDVAGQVGPEAPMARRGNEFHPLIEADCLRIGGRQLRQFPYEQESILGHEL